MAFPLPNVGLKPVKMDPSKRYKRYDTIIGEGAMKNVYLGLDSVEGNEVAWCKTELTKEILKNKKLVEHLCTEAQLMKVLRHDNIVKCFESWIDYEHRIINMIIELLPPCNLEEYVRRYQPSKKRVIREWCKQILRGLEYLHSLNIIHRDLSSDNIFIDGGLSTVKIGDLGLALIVEPGVPSSVPRFSCRPEFMAPELFEGHGVYSELIDIYSFGMCVLQMATQEGPYSECKDKDQIRAKAKEGVMPDALSHVEERSLLKEFIEKCLKSASERPDASALLRDPFILSNDSDTEAGSSSSSSQSVSKTVDRKQKGPAAGGVLRDSVLQFKDSTYEVGSSSKSAQKKSLRLRVQPRIARFRARYLGDDSYKGKLYFNNAGFDFDFKLRSEATLDVMSRNFGRDKAALSDMSTQEYFLISELLICLTTSLKSQQDYRPKLFEVTSEDNKARPVFQQTTTRQHQQQQHQHQHQQPPPEATDTMQQPETTETMQQP